MKSQHFYQDEVVKENTASLVFVFVTLALVLSVAVVARGLLRKDELRTLKFFSFAMYTIVQKSLQKH